MKLIGLMPCRNEAWCIGLTARAALMWCDELICLNHASTDATEEVLESLRAEFKDPRRDYPYDGRITWLHESEPLWDEMRHRQMMLEMAREQKATHIAIVDADEILTGNLVGHGYHVKSFVPSGVGQTQPLILQLPGYNLRGSINQYHSNGVWGNRWFDLAFADDPRLHWKGDQFHHRQPWGVNFEPYRPIAQGEGGILHLWGASERRLKAKQALYKLTERLKWPQKSIADIDRYYNQAIYGRYSRHAATDFTFAQVPAAWWKPYDHLMKYLEVAAEPWQEAEARRLVQLHGPALFQGLDLFGVT